MNQFLESLIGNAGSRPARSPDPITRMHDANENLRRCREFIKDYERAVARDNEELAKYYAQLPTLEAALQLEIEKFKGEK